MRNRTAYNLVTWSGRIFCSVVKTKPKIGVIYLSLCNKIHTLLVMEHRSAFETVAGMQGRCPRDSW